MNPVKNGLVWGSIFRHALALCLAVPFAVKADTAFNWGSSGDFDSVTGSYNDTDPDNIVFSATLTQTETITLSQTSATFSQIALDGRRNSGFSEQFISQLLAIDRNLPYAEWSLSSVLIEIESASVSGTFSVSLDGKNHSIPNSSVTLTIGNFKLTSGNDSSTGSSVIFGGEMNNRVTVSGDNPKSIAFGTGATGSMGMTLQGPVNGKVTGSWANADFEGDDSLNLVLDTDTPLASGFLDQPNGNHPATSASSTVSLSGLNLNLKITYVITPEPGTMALLLTGVPLLLVRRRKSLKKV